MSIQEKQAWYLLIMSVVTMITYLIVGMMLGFHHRQFYMINGFIIGIYYLVPVISYYIGNRERARGEIVEGERDRSIAKTATLYAFAVGWLFSSLVIIFTPMYIPVWFLHDIQSLPYWLLFLVRSIAILLLYRRPSCG